MRTTEDGVGQGMGQVARANISGFRFAFSPVSRLGEGGREESATSM